MPSKTTSKTPNFFKDQQQAVQSWIEDWQRTSEVQARLLAITGEAGVGRSAFLEKLLSSLQGTSQYRFSALETPLLPAFMKVLHLETLLSEEKLFQAWQEKLKSHGEEEPIVLIFEDVHEAEPMEQKFLVRWIQQLLLMKRRILIIIEFIPNALLEHLSFSAETMKTLSLTPLSEAQVGEWKKSIDSKTVHALYQRTQGVWRELVLWDHFLQAKNFYQKAKLKQWPRNLEDLAKQQAQSLTSTERSILQTMHFHPSWIHPELIEVLFKISEAESEAVLTKFENQAWVKGARDSKRWLLTFTELGKVVSADLSKAQRAELHQNLFYYLRDHATWYLPTWLAYHAAEGALVIEAYAWNLLAGEAYAFQGDAAAAQAYFERAGDFAQDLFKKSYAGFQVGEALLMGGQFSQALVKFRQALDNARQVPWDELVQECSLKIAQTLCHLGCYAEAESYFQTGLKLLQAHGWDAEFLKQSQNLSVAYLEQASYHQAWDLLTDLQQQYEQRGDRLGVLSSQISLVHVFLALGKAGDALELLANIQNSLAKESIRFWEPVLQLLQGRVHGIQGNWSHALRWFQEAAKGFEQIGDVSGKVEVLLAMTAPLLEYQLTDEAKRLIDFIAHWEELQNFPALQHSVQLRRLTIGAFSGQWNREDLILAQKSSRKVGRKEDWLGFWFHLALAAQRRGEEKFFHSFLEQAHQVAESIAQNLSKAERAGFFKRPDIARIFRLLETPSSVRIRGKRTLPTQEKAEEASLAPPTSKGLKKDE